MPQWSRDFGPLYWGAMRRAAVIMRIDSMGLFVREGKDPPPLKGGVITYRILPHIMYYIYPQPYVAQGSTQGLEETDLKEIKTGLLY